VAAPPPRQVGDGENDQTFCGGGPGQAAITRDKDARIGGGVGSVIGYIGGRIAQFIHAGVDERRRLPGQCVIVRYPNAARPTRQECAIARIVRRCGYGVQGKASDSLVARDPCGAPVFRSPHSVVICRSV